MRQLGPFVFDHSAHFIRDMVDVLYIEHVLVRRFRSAGSMTLPPTRRGL